ncbi:MAG TPA: pantoate--beta-alanine ligase [Pyrinomonadaceae bacterium]|nr:pantoate--beta-alanine ligase [Pyrinomonadaceae bacterium]
MEIIDLRQRMISVARQIRREGNRTIAFVPTMGALHAGHLSLVQAARAKCDVVVVSVFVNPAQFGPREDFTSYPRDLTRDLALLAESNVDYVFAPAVKEIYPKGFSTYVTVEGLSDQLEGASRPGHFRGVTTIVALLLNIIRPDFAFFGQKDAQQAIVIKQMVRDLAFDSEAVVLPTARAESGLALSSRNDYLDDKQRKAATVLYRGLSRAAAEYDAGERNAKRLIEAVKSAIDKEPLARVDYVSINDAETLERLDELGNRPALISMAAFIGKTRLIDNFVLGKAKKQDASGAKA